MASAWLQLGFSLASETIQLGYNSTDLNRTGLRLMDLCYDGWTDRVPQKAPTSTDTNNSKWLHYFVVTCHDDRRANDDGVCRFHMHKTASTMIPKRVARRKPFSVHRIALSVLLFGTAILLYNLIRIHQKVTDSTNDDGLAASGRSNPATVPLPPSRKKSCSRSKIRTAQDLKRCTSAKTFLQLEPSCEQIETWQDVQRCLVRRFFPEPAERYEIHIIGERNSGTKFIMRELQQCFPKEDFTVRIHRDFVRAKHFFQPTHRNSRRGYRKSIIIAIFRDPVEWTAAMIQKPYHSPNHIAGFDNVTGEVIPMAWQDFVARRWKTPRSKFDMELIRAGRVEETLNGLICKELFTFTEVIPCRYDYNTSKAVPEDKLRGYEPIYELRRDGTGRSFEHILELRSEKIFNFLLELPLLLKLGGFVAVRYEDLLTNGTQSFLENVADIIGVDGGLPATCKPTPPQPGLFGKRPVSQGLREWVNEHVDVERERLLGYRD